MTVFYILWFISSLIALSLSIAFIHENMNCGITDEEKFCMILFTLFAPFAIMLGILWCVWYCARILYIVPKKHIGKLLDSLSDDD